MIDAQAPNRRQPPETADASHDVMPHTKTEVRQADRARMPLRVLMISTTIALATLGTIALAYIIFARNGVN